LAARLRLHPLGELRCSPDPSERGGNQLREEKGEDTEKREGIRKGKKKGQLHTCGSFQKSAMDQ